MSLVLLPPATDRRPSSVPVRPVRQALLELSIAAAVFAIYRLGRLVTIGSVDVARANADRVLSLQDRLVGPVELTVQRWALRVPGLIEALNHFYVGVHFPATVAFLVWVFVRHRDRFGAIRNWFIGVTFVAMVVHVLFPLAPPRMLDGYVDTLRVFGPSIYPEDPSRSVANQFAAMPSLHFGWALMVAVGIALITDAPRRWWWFAHPVVTLLAIVATANHYLLDAVVAGLLVGMVGVVTLRRVSLPRGTSGSPGGETTPAIGCHSLGT